MPNSLEHKNSRWEVDTQRKYIKEQCTKQTKKQLLNERNWACICIKSETNHYQEKYMPEQCDWSVYQYPAT